ncbi:MAG: D-2-hydroxyacid dehydrogenase [Clostridia bacterium]|nr:D-2-hydroxyacid dehydrogenase [Clostridia bacterium]
MSKILLVDVRELTQDQRAAIDAAARQRGYRAAFVSSEAEAEAIAPEAEILFSLNAALLPRAPKLKWLCVPFAGVDAYLKPALEDRRDILLSSSSGAYGVTIAEHIVMVTLMLMRRQMEYTEVVRRGGWRRDLPIRAIHGSRIAVLGAGDIGREAAVRLRAFAPASIVGVNRSGRNPGDIFDAVVPVDALDDLLPRVDLLIMALPGTPETRHILDARRLELLPEDAFIVNVGRGSAIDEAALASQLRAGRFAGVALDVFEHEPLPPDDPLRACPRLLITPHVAGNMTLSYTVARIVELFLEDFANYCDGRPLARRVEPGKGY